MYQTLISINPFKPIAWLVFAGLAAVLFSACHRDDGGDTTLTESLEMAMLPEIKSVPEKEAVDRTTSPPPALRVETADQQLTHENTRYLFDISEHSREELMLLLQRADEVATVAGVDFNDMDIALVLHGPDIAWFARSNYEENKDLVDLAARLDALGVIKLKVCKKAMVAYGFVEDEIPAFIDRVAYAPDEMRRLQGSGYFTL
ncbi:MAG: DsrE family protein [Gammaproteobacteria bacterium]